MSRNINAAARGELSPFHIQDNRSRPLLGLHDYGRLETAAYDQLDILSPMRGRLNRTLRDARVVPTAEIPPNAVTLGSTVRYRIGTGPAERRILLLERYAAPTGQYLSALTPVGLALLGRLEGETVEAPTFESGILSIHIERVEHQPEADARRRSAARPDGPDNNGPEAA